jgi:hypothetical protein
MGSGIEPIAQQGILMKERTWRSRQAENGDVDHVTAKTNTTECFERQRQRGE